MAKQTAENQFIKRATKMGLEAMLVDVNELLKEELSEGLRVTNEEMKTQILQYLDELK